LLFCSGRPINCGPVGEATLFNDVAIALFVLDVFLVMIGWPATVPDESFAETYAEHHDKRVPLD
jgi:hypothetical protein